MKFLEICAMLVLKQKLLYKHEQTGNHDAHLFAESGVHLELHYKLDTSGEQWNLLLENVWDYLVDNSKAHGILTEEMFY